MADKLEIYHQIWEYLHCQEFLNKPLEIQLEEFEKIIVSKLNFCSCGGDAQFIITFMITFYENISSKKFWCLFHNIVKLKLNQQLTHFDHLED